MRSRLPPLGRIVFPLLFFLCFVWLQLVQGQSEAVVDSFRSRISAIKNDMVRAVYDGERARAGLADAERVLASLLESRDYRILAATYAVDNRHVRWPAIRMDRENPVGTVLALERFLDHVHRIQTQSSSFLLAFLGIVLGALALLFVWLHFDGQKQILLARHERDLSQKLLDTIERERTQLAFDLHDSVAQKLGMIKQHLRTGEGEDAATEPLNLLVGEAIKEIRYVYGTLNSTVTEELDLPLRLTELCEQFRANCPMVLEYRILGLDALRVPERTANHIVRMAQELLNNGRKHSRAQRILLNLVWLPPMLRLVYQDDGQGIGPSEGQELPFRSLQYRATLLGARCRFLSGANRVGLLVQIEVPLENNPDS